MGALEGMVDDSCPGQPGWPIVSEIGTRAAVGGAHGPSWGRRLEYA